MLEAICGYPPYMVKFNFQRLSHKNYCRYKYQNLQLPGTYIYAFSIKIVCLCCLYFEHNQYNCKCCHIYNGFDWVLLYYFGTIRRRDTQILQKILINRLYTTAKFRISNSNSFCVTCVESSI